MFDKTVLTCEQMVDPGIFNQQSRFLYIVDQTNVINGTRPQDILLAGNDHVGKHMHTTVIQRVLTKNPLMAKYNFYAPNIFVDKPQVFYLNTWSPLEKFTSKNDAYISMFQFNGKAKL